MHLSRRMVNEQIDSAVDIAYRLRMLIMWINEKYETRQRPFMSITETKTRTQCNAYALQRIRKEKMIMQKMKNLVIINFIMWVATRLHFEYTYFVIFEFLYYFIHWAFLARLHCINNLTCAQ